MKKKICIVISEYYPNIAKNLLNGASAVLKKNGINDFKILKAPGVFEIPYVISKVINQHEAFIALGCVIKGKTPHFDLISTSTINGLMNLSINHKKPIGNGILNCLNISQAEQRSNPKKKNKGGEAAKAIIQVIKI